MPLPVSPVTPNVAVPSLWDRFCLLVGGERPTAECDRFASPTPSIVKNLAVPSMWPCRWKLTDWLKNDFFCGTLDGLTCK